MLLNHAWIAARIPHHGDMCLLDRVDEWHADRVICRAISHRDPCNPLRSHDRLAAACGIEYAAQAMAVHGALLAQNAPQRQGFLASVRGARLYVRRLDDIKAELTIEVTRSGGDDITILYDFAVRADEQLLLDGRAAIFMNPD